MTSLPIPAVKLSKTFISTGSQVDCLFINPRDLVAAVPYVKSISHAAVLRAEGIRVDMIDPAPSNISIKEIIKIIADKKPRLICLSAFPSTLPDAYQTVLMIKARFPETVLVLEGYHVNADPTIIIEMGIHYGLLGDSEYTLLELCRSFLTDSSVNNSLIGLAINDNGKLIKNKPAVINDINALPVPAYDLLPIGKYYSASTNKRIMYLFTTRGCPYDCNFCASALQRNYRYLNTDNALKYIEDLVVRHNVEWIEFMDLTFTISKKRTIELCEAIIAAGIKFEWGCETRADLIDEEILLKMKSAGCKKITIGVEAGNEEIRYKTGKKIKNEVFIQAFKLCRKQGIKTMANFILGHPGETEQQVNDTINMAIALRPFNVFFSRMTPLPDIDIYADGVAKGEIAPDIWVRYMKGETGHPIYYTRAITRERFDKLYRKAFYKFYLRPDTVRNYMSLLKDPNFLLRSAGIFLRIVFGKPVFK